jgi:adenosine deaminase
VTLTTTLSAADAAFIDGMPKAELHVHLEGTLERGMRRELAARNGLAIADDSSADDGFAYNDLTSFLAAYYPAMDVLLTEDDFHDLAHAYLVKAASQGVRHTEMFFDPQAHTSRGVAFETVIRGYHRAVQGAADLGVSAQLILCILRDHSAESGMQTLLEALPYRDLIVGIGLDSDERGNPPEKFQAVFARAREEGLHLTMHCDVDQVGSIDNIRTALEVIGVDRLDHGTNIVEDVALVALVIERGIGLTSCPLSNAIVSEGGKTDEIVALLRAGVKITVNSDDPPYFGGYIAENLRFVAEQTDVTRAELVQLQRNAFEISWIDDATRERLLAELDAWVAAS